MTKTLTALDGILYYTSHDYPGMIIKQMPDGTKHFYLIKEDRYKENNQCNVN